MTNVDTQADDTPGIGETIRGLGVDLTPLGDGLTLQLTLAARLARFCTQELKRAGRGAGATTPWFSKAVQDKTFDIVYARLHSASNVSASSF